MMNMIIEKVDILKETKLVGIHVINVLFDKAEILDIQMSIEDFYLFQF
jgi:hypothetical protein